MPNTLDRSWLKVDRSGGSDACWPWTAGLNKWGYGQFYCDGKNVGAHVFAFKTKKELPDGMFVLHECDNRPCCNPKHLLPGTHDANMADMKAKGRARAPKGSEHGRAKLTEDAVRAIRAAYVPFSRKLGTRALARQFKVSPAAVQFALNGKKWAHVQLGA